jgi:3-hydroxybutyryl-CoA dehydrogenase
MITGITTVGIAGAGTMGHSIAQLCANAGLRVVLFDVNVESLKNGINQIERNADALIEKGKLTTEGKKTMMERISTVSNLSELVADIIIEAIIEDLGEKQKLFAEIEARNSSETLILTNTSSFPITQLAGKLKTPGRFAGLHFFNPAVVMKLVEVIKGISTEESTIAKTILFAREIGKEPILVQDCPGFVVNRVARHYYVEALKLLEDGVADIPTIDRLMKSAGFRMGPFELMDLIGVDTNLAVTKAIYNAFHQDSKFRPSRIQQQKVDAGHLGKKSGKGFYDY